MTLVRKVRTLSVDQVARTWFWERSDPTRAARTQLRELASRGLVRLSPAMSYDELAFPAPLALWRPGSELPNFAQLAERLLRRWPDVLRPVTLVNATPAGAAWCGGTRPRPSRPSEVSHDLSLAALYLMFRQSDKARANAWVAESTLQAEGYGKPGGYLPDAALRGSDGETLLELAGVYSEEKLLGMHRFAAFHGVPYEVW